jgi:hypothetical protein
MWGGVGGVAPGAGLGAAGGAGAGRAAPGPAPTVSLLKGDFGGGGCKAIGVNGGKRPPLESSDPSFRS